MKTGDLVNMLSTNIEAVDRHLMTRTLAGAVTIGFVVALGVALIMLGGRADFWSAGALAFMAAKLAFALAVAALAFSYLIRGARPAGNWRRSLALVALPFVGIKTFAGISMAFAPAAHWQMMFMGNEWLECLLSIPIIAVVPFALVIWAMRQAAPTDLRQQGRSPASSPGD